MQETKENKGPIGSMPDPDQGEIDEDGQKHARLAQAPECNVKGGE